jgi:hypothetical protein
LYRGALKGWNKPFDCPVLIRASRNCAEGDAAMFGASDWRDDRTADVETIFPGLRQPPMQHLLASWAVTVMIGLAALAASVL